MTVTAESFFFIALGRHHFSSWGLPPTPLKVQADRIRRRL